MHWAKKLLGFTHFIGSKHEHKLSTAPHHVRLIDLVVRLLPCFPRFDQISLFQYREMMRYGGLREFEDSSYLSDPTPFAATRLHDFFVEFLSAIAFPKIRGSTIPRTYRHSSIRQVEKMPAWPWSQLANVCGSWLMVSTLCQSNWAGPLLPTE